MNNKLPLRDGLPEILGTVIDQNGKTHTLHRGPRQHDSLTSEQLTRVARLQGGLKEAYPMTLDGWVDSFLGETYPEKEISIIESLAVIYLKLTTNTKLTLKEKKSLYSLLCAISCGVPLKDLKKEIPKGLPSARTIHKMYRKELEDGARP